MPTHTTGALRLTANLCAFSLIIASAGFGAVFVDGSQGTQLLSRRPHSLIRRCFGRSQTPGHCDKFVRLWIMVNCPRVRAAVVGLTCRREFDHI
jgi:hypothetical protein